MYSSELLRKRVLDKNGNNMGRVEDVNINLPQWTIDHIILRRNLIKTVTISLDVIDKVGDRIILKITRDELDKS